MDTENRINELENELKLLKGEVKKTLVDLRAFVMRQDSPLNESARLPKSLAGVGTGSTQGQRVEEGRAAEASPGAPVARRPGAPPQPGTPPDAPGQPPQGGPGPSQGGPSVWAPSGPGTPPAGGGWDPAPNGKGQAGPGSPAAQGWEWDGGRSGEPSGGPAADAGERSGDDERPGRERMQAAQNGGEAARGGRVRRDPEARGEERSRGERDLDRRSRRRGASSRGDGRHPREGRSAHARGRDPAWTGDPEDDDIADERGGPDPDVAAGSLSLLDTNLVANLVRWVSTTRSRVGMEGLQHLLSLYDASGHGTPALRQLLLQMADLVQEQPGGDAQPPSLECVDLMHQLHGILTSDQAPLVLQSMDSRQLSEAEED